MVEKFAETLAVKNKAYDTLVRQAKDAAATVHAERLRSKKESEDQRRRIQELMVEPKSAEAGLSSILQLVTCLTAGLQDLLGAITLLLGAITLLLARPDPFKEGGGSVKVFPASKNLSKAEANKVRGLI